MVQTLTMSVKERVRLDLVKRLERGELTRRQAAEALGLSLRQMSRIADGFRRMGDAGVVHGLRGKPGNRRVCDTDRRRVMDLYHARYQGFGATLASECLFERQRIKVAVSTLRDWLREEGLRPRGRRGRKHRSRRVRRASVGELVQMDGSEHDWFGSGGRCILFVMVDDATGRLFCRFYDSEETASAFDLFGRYVERYGLPVALYVDKDSIYTVNNREPTVEEALKGIKPRTQFGRAMDSLGVSVILADSPQAKGRVERMNGTLQDRLVKELALEGIKDIPGANEYLEEVFLDKFNHKFMVDPASKADLHRNVPRNTDLGHVLCVIDDRVVSKDWCIQHNGRVWQIGPKHQGLRLAGKTVQVLTLVTGDVCIKYKGKTLKGCIELPCLPVKHTGKPKAAQRVKTHRPYKPTKNAPWRRFKIKHDSQRAHKESGGGRAPSPARTHPLPP